MGKMQGQENLSTAFVQDMSISAGNINPSKVLVVLQQFLHLRVRHLRVHVRPDVRRIRRVRMAKITTARPASVLPGGRGRESCRLAHFGQRL